MSKVVRAVAVLSVFVLAMGMASCSGGSAASSSSASGSKSASSVSASSASSESASSTAASSKSDEPIDDDNTTDQMYRDSLEQAKLYGYVKDGEALSAEYGYRIDLHSVPDLKEGSYYEVVADVDLLNGGIAGYVNYPEVKRVYSCTEVSREDVPESSRFD